MHRYRRLLAVLGALVLVVAACGDDDDSEPSGGGDGNGDSSGVMDEVGESEGEVVIVARRAHAEADRARIDPAAVQVLQISQHGLAQAGVEAGDARCRWTRRVLQGLGRALQARCIVVSRIERLRRGIT